MHKAPNMNKWVPDDNPMQDRRINKTMEELAELMAVCTRINNQGMDGIDPATGKTNRQRFHEESADVAAQLNCNTRAFSMDVAMMTDRCVMKESWMAQWESHYHTESDNESLDSTSDA